MYATHHPAWDAKNRHQLPDEMPMDYAQIAHIFVNQQAPQQQMASVPEVAPVQTAHEQSVSNANTLEQTQTVPVQQEEQREEIDKVGINHTGINGDQGPQHLASELDPNIPQSLRDLMTQHSVSEYEIQAVVSKRGYYPQGTPITNYDDGFIEGALVGAWDQVHQMIKDLRDKIPFN